MWTDERTPRCRRNGRSGCVDAGRVARLVRNDLAREPLRGAALDHGPDVVHRQQQAHAGGDLEVGGVPLRRRRSRRCSISSSTRSIRPGSASRSRRTFSSVALFTRRASAATGGAMRAARPHRDPGLRALEIGGELGAVVLQRVPDDAARHRLKHLVPPRLGLLDGAPALGSRGNSGGDGTERVQRAGDRPRALEPRAVELHGRHRDPREPHRPEGALVRAPASGRTAGSRCPCGAASAPR